MNQWKFILTSPQFNHLQLQVPLRWVIALNSYLDSAILETKQFIIALIQWN